MCSIGDTQAEGVCHHTRHALPPPPEQYAKGLQRLHCGVCPGVGGRHQHTAANVLLLHACRSKGGRK
jgi:hypothetical protein